MLPEQERDFDDWSDRDLAEELAMIDSLTEDYQIRINNIRKKLNRFMEQRENLLDEISRRAGKKGWTK